MCTHGSVVACGLDGETGEMFERRLTPDHREILERIGGLPEPVAAVAAAQPARRLAGCARRRPPCPAPEVFRPRARLLYVRCLREFLREED